MIEARNSWVILSTILLALLIHTLPIPFEWRWYRPEFPMLVIFYWSLALPHRVGIISAALTGLGLDLLNGSALGALAIGMVVADLFILLTYQRIRQFDALQQVVTMGALVALALLIEHWLLNMLGLTVRTMTFLWSAPMAALAWLPVRELLRGLRRYYEVV